MYRGIAIAVEIITEGELPCRLEVVRHDIDMEEAVFAFYFHYHIGAKACQRGVALCPLQLTHDLVIASVLFGDVDYVLDWRGFFAGLVWHGVVGLGYRQFLEGIG